MNLPDGVPSVQWRCLCGTVQSPLIGVRTLPGSKQAGPTTRQTQPEGTGASEGVSRDFKLSRHSQLCQTSLSVPVCPDLGACTSGWSPSLTFHHGPGAGSAPSSALGCCCIQLDNLIPSSWGRDSIPKQVPCVTYPRF